MDVRFRDRGCATGARVDRDQLSSLFAAVGRERCPLRRPGPDLVEAAPRRIAQVTRAGAGLRARSRPKGPPAGRKGRKRCTSTGRRRASIRPPTARIGRGRCCSLRSGNRTPAGRSCAAPPCRIRAPGSSRSVQRSGARPRAGWEEATWDRRARSGPIAGTKRFREIRRPPRQHRARQPRPSSRAVGGPAAPPVSGPWAGSRAPPPCARGRS